VYSSIIKSVHFRLISRITILAFVIFSACSRPESAPSPSEDLTLKITGQWYKTNLFPKKDPMILEFDSGGLCKHFDFRNGTTFYNFQIKDSTLFLGQNATFCIHRMTEDSLVLSPSYEPHRKICYTSQDPTELDTPEKNIFMLLPALGGSTVEKRVRNLIQLFDNEDFVTTETLFFLAGITPNPIPNERNDVPKQRQVLQNVQSIQKINDEFIVHFHNSENIKLRLPIYESPAFGAKQKALLDLLIKTDTKARVIPLKKGGVRIDIDGIKVGKGWFKVDIPTFVVENDMGKLLGIKFSLLRKLSAMQK